MKIAIPADDQSMDSIVCPSFGRSPYYLIYNIKVNEPRFIANQAANSQGGAGIQAAQLLVDEKVQAVLTPRCGRNAADVLTAAGIQLYRSKKASLKENIEAYITGQLDPLEDIHPGYHKHGGR